MTGTASYIASNAAYAGTETINAVLTGDYSNLASKGASTALSLANAAALNSGVNSYVVGYANNALTLLKYKLWLAANSKVSTFKYGGEHNNSTGRRSLRDFINHVNRFGVLVQNNFEVEFLGITGLTLFITGIELPGSKQTTSDVYFDGIKMTIPVVYDHGHEFTMTIMNDANGVIYTLLKKYVELDSYVRKVDTGMDMIVKAFSGQVSTNVTGRKDDKYEMMPYCGSVIRVRNVRLTSIDGLQFGQSSNEALTFNVHGTLLDYNYIPIANSNMN